MNVDLLNNERKAKKPKVDKWRAHRSLALQGVSYSPLGALVMMLKLTEL